MPTQPVLIAVEPAQIGSRTVPTVSLHAIHGVIAPRQSFFTWRDRTLRQTVLARDLDYAAGGLVTGSCETSYDIRLSIPAARQVLARLSGIRANQLNSDLVAWEQAVAAEGVVPQNEAPFVGHLFAYEPPADQGSTHLSIAGADVRQDTEGRYCLNDCHKAAGGEKKDEPGRWLRLDTTKGLIAELGETTQFWVVTVEGRNGGTYVARELVYAYAMWISPAFHLTVIRAFDAMVHRGENLHAQPAPTDDQQAWAAWLALPLAERRCRQRDIATFGRTYGVEGMRHAMKRVGLPAPPTYTADASGQFVMPFQQIAGPTISDPPEGSA